MSSQGNDDFRVLRQAAEAALRYRETIPDQPQRPRQTYNEMVRTIDMATPENGAPAASVLEELQSISEPGLQAMTGPRFFGWVVGASHPVGVAADWLTSAWGQNAGNHEATPAAAVIEETAGKWLLDILALPKQCSVGFVTGATMGNFVCLAAARSKVLRAVGWDVEGRGLFEAPPINILIGDDAHTVVFAVLRMLGLGQDRVQCVPTDVAGRIIPARFLELLHKCEGPTIAIAQAGQVNTGAFDPVAQMAEHTQQCGAWLHVDAAFGLWARACPETAYLARGIEAADSWAVDGHKWLQAPYDSGYAIVAHPADHRRAMTADASYLPAAGANERAPAHFVPELSRRARGFATWAMIRHLGRCGIAEMVGRHCRLARRMADQLSTTPGIVVVNDVELNQVIVRFGCDEASDRADELTAQVIELVQAGGTCFAGGARWRGHWVMRLSIVAWPTTESDVDTSAAAITAAWKRVKASHQAAQ